jgi:hypothetical protein
MSGEENVQDSRPEGGHVNPAEVLKRLEVLLQNAERDRMFGAIEITLRGGRATVITKTETDRLDQYGDNRGISHVNKQTYR